MKCKRFLVIMLVSVLLCTSISAVVGANVSRDEIREKAVSRTLPAGLSSFFSKILKAFPLLGTIFKIAAPQGSSEIKEPSSGIASKPLLSFKIELMVDDPENIPYGEPIIVSATLTNNGKSPIQLCEMDVKLKTLNFEIKTPAGKKIVYLGPFGGTAKGVVLNASQSIYSKIDLTDPKNIFGAPLVPPGGVAVKPYNFIRGDYSIRGIYTSKKIDNPDPKIRFWEGNLTSETLEFTIV